MEQLTIALPPPPPEVESVIVTLAVPLVAVVKAAQKPLYAPAMAFQFPLPVAVVAGALPSLGVTLKAVHVAPRFAVA